MIHLAAREPIWNRRRAISYREQIFWMDILGFDNWRRNRAGEAVGERLEIRTFVEPFPIESH